MISAYFFCQIEVSHWVTLHTNSFFIRLIISVIALTQKMRNGMRVESSRPCSLYSAGQDLHGIWLTSRCCLSSGHLTTAEAGPPSLRIFLKEKIWSGDILCSRICHVESFNLTSK